MNIKKIKAALMIIIMLLLVCLSSGEKLYSLSLVRNDKGLAFSKVEVVDGEIPPQNPPDNEYSIQIKDFDDKVIYTNNFNLMLYQQSKVKIPYFKNGKEINIFTKTKSLPFSITVAHFADTCGNGVCEIQENFLLCKEDCVSGEKDSYCDGIEDNICDPDCYQKDKDNDCILNEKEDQEIDKKEIPSPEKVIAKNTSSKQQESKLEEKEEFLNWKLIVVVLVAIVLIILGIIIYEKRKARNKNTEKLRGYISYWTNKGYSYQQVYQGLIKYGYTPKEIEKAKEKLDINKEIIR